MSVGNVLQFSCVLDDREHKHYWMVFLVIYLVQLKLVTMNLTRHAKNEEKVMLARNPNEPLVALAFKLEEGCFGHLTYLSMPFEVTELYECQYKDFQEAHAGKELQSLLPIVHQVPQLYFA
ncbi:hypothetical protein Dsin_012592 [Dipteronia sinensis]|uniref:Uncharacterized protein n=1 Tax=Dipteronia sinensis TaxID=43782 RepID=A0AAE0AJN1_9ROSI|nr:hypothetical protein Dsin_012592 [Dipteronia sinensis]